MSKTIKWLVTVLAAVLVLAACGSSAGDGSSSSPTGGGVPLVGTDWSLVSFPDATTGAATRVPAKVSVDATFREQTVGGSSGCNTFGGPYTVDGSAMHVGPVGGTLVACLDDRGTVETAFLKAMNAVTSYAIADETLTLTTSLKSPLVFRELKPTPLVGTTWLATSVNNGKQGVETVDPQGTISLVFAASDVSGTDGCHTVTGPYTTSGTSLTFGSLSSTQQLCVTGPPVPKQGRHFVPALERVTTYTISGATLELRDDEGALQVAFTAK